MKLSRDTVVLAAIIAIVSALGGVWLGSTASLAAPLEQVSSDALTPKPINGAHADIEQLLSKLGCRVGEFVVLSAVRDESLGRRFYRIRVSTAQVSRLFDQV